MTPVKYLSARLKRSVRLYPVIFAVTVLLIAAIILAGVLILGSYRSSDETKKLELGITGDLSDDYLSAGISAVKRLDSSRFTIDFKELEEEEAKRELMDLSIDGFLRIPTGFMDSMFYGGDLQVTYVARRAPTTFSSFLILEIADAASKIVTESANALNVINDVAKDNGLNGNKLEDVLYNEYLGFALVRNEVSDIEYIGVSEGLTIGGYYACAVLVFFLLMWGISSHGILFKKDRSIEKLLYSNGVKSVRQVLCEYVGYFLLTLFTLAVIMAIVGSAVTLSRVDTGIEELSGAGLYDFLSFTVKIIPAVLLMTALHTLVYEALPSRVSVIITEFLLAVGGGYISGCFYPDHFFPVSLQKAASVLPIGVSFRFVKETLASELSDTAIVAAAAYSLLFLALTAAIRQYRMAGEK
ncbi:MAG: ABC transporter permease [Clostridia bacterium]|nr:ABC transporter permease [Clostridia bacterium]